MATKTSAECLLHHLVHVAPTTDTRSSQMTEQRLVIHSVMCVVQVEPRSLSAFWYCANQRTLHLHISQRGSDHHTDPPTRLVPIRHRSPSQATAQTSIQRPAYREPPSITWSPRQVELTQSHNSSISGGLGCSLCL